MLGKLVYSLLALSCLAVVTASQLFRHADQGLEHVVFDPTWAEWASTYDGDMSGFGPVHVWMRCLSGRLRGYVFNEERNGASFWSRLEGLTKSVLDQGKYQTTGLLSMRSVL